MVTNTFDSMEPLLVGISEGPQRYCAAINICHAGRMALAARRTSDTPSGNTYKRLLPECILALCDPAFPHTARGAGDSGAPCFACVQ